MAADVAGARLLAHTRHCHGFPGASSMERVSTEQALRAQGLAFKAIDFRRDRPRGYRAS